MDELLSQKQETNNRSYEQTNCVVLDIPKHHDHEMIAPSKQIHKVPPHFRKRKAHRDAYDPIIISMGPYHHGKPEFSRAELFKNKCLDVFVNESSNDEFFFQEKVLERIHDIRGWYEEVTYDDQALARLILCDSCFFIYYMQMFTVEIKYEPYRDYFGVSTQGFIERDLLLMENQIPFWIVKFLISLQSDNGQLVWQKMLSKFMNHGLFGNVGNLRTLSSPGDERYEPLHFLDAVRYYHVIKVKVPEQLEISRLLIGRRNLYDTCENASYRYRSATTLNAKGISFKLSKPVDGEGIISFTSHSFYGQLGLPPVILSTNFFTLYSNLIAYEMAPTSKTDFRVTASLNFMKSLIESSNDVKILREEGILISNIGSDDEIAKVFKDFDTFGVDNLDVFAELRASIARHCSSKAKTWRAELIHTYFRSPWTVIALLAAIFVLGLTIFRTFFSMYQVIV